MSDEAWDKTVRINLSGPFYFSKRVVNHLIQKGKRGKNYKYCISGGFSWINQRACPLCSCKRGLVTFTISLAREVAKHGINVIAVAPGMMRTPMNVKELAEREEEYIKRIPLGRISEPKEVAYAVAFLVSDKADYITGATIDVTGGMLMR